MKLRPNLKTITTVAPTFVGAGTPDQSIGGLTLAPHASTVANDIMLMVLNSAALDAFSTPTGWTSVGTSNDITTSRLTVFFRRFVGGDTNWSVTDSGDHNLGIILTFRGCPTASTPIDVSSFTSNVSASTSFSVTGVTPTQFRDMIVVCISSLGPSSTSNPANEYSGYTNANLSNLTEIADCSTSSGNDGAIGVACGVSIGGATGSTTGSIATNSKCSKATIALFGV